MNTKYTVLFNPLAGNKTAKKEVYKLDELLPNDDLNYVEMTPDFHYKEFINSLPDGECVVICGGDGTINALINDIDNSCLSRQIYYYPLGSGNDFNRDIFGDEYKHLLRINDLLKINGIHIVSLYVVSSMGSSILRLIVDKPEVALHMLRDDGFDVGMTAVILVRVPDSAMALKTALGILSDRKIETEYLYVYADESGNAVIVYKVADCLKAAEILSENDIHVLSAEEVYSNNG